MAAGCRDRKADRMRREWLKRERIRGKLVVGLGGVVIVFLLTQLVDFLMLLRHHDIDRGAVVGLTLLGLVLPVAAAGVVAVLLADDLSHGLAGLIAGARRIAAGQVEERVHLDRFDEIGETALAVNAIADQMVANAVEMERAIASAQAGEARMRAIVASVGEAIFTFDEAGLLLSANRMAERIFGREAPDLVKQPVTTLMADPPGGDGASGFVHWAIERVDGGRARGSELVGRRAGGDRFPMELIITDVRHDGERHFIGVARDLTERKRSERLLQQSEEQLRLAVQAAGMVILEWDIPSDVVSLTSRSIELDPNDPVLETNNERFLARLHPDDLPQVVSGVERALASDGDYRAEYRYVDSHGRVRWNAEIGRVELDADGRPKLIRAVKLDITDRKLAEEGLANERDLLQSLVDTLPDLIFVKDTASRFTLVNRALAQQFGLSDPSEAIGKTDLDFHPGAVAERFAADEREVLTTGTPILNQLDATSDADQGGRWTLTTKVAITDRGGEITGLVGSSRDITELRRAQDAQRDAEARYRQLVEQIPAVVYMDGLGDGEAIGRPLYVSPQIETMLGYPIADWLTDGSIWARVLHPDDRPRVSAAVLAAQATGEPYAIEYRMIARDGRTVWVQSEAVLVRDESGQPLHWQGITIDVTARKLAAEALWQAETKYQTLVEQMPVIVFTQEITADNSPGPLLYVSPQIESVLGYPSQTWLSDDTLFARVVHVDDRDRVLALLGHHHATMEPYVAEFRVIADDGRPVWLRSQAAPVRDEAGTPLHWQGIHIDITAQRLAEAAAREADARYRVLVEQIPAITYTLAPGHPERVSFISPQVETILGLTPSEVVDRENLLLAYIHPDDLERYRAEDERTNQTGDPFSLEYRMRTRSGERVWIRDEAVLIADQAGQPPYWQGIMFDLTASKRSEEARREAEARYQALVEQLPAVVYTEALSDGETLGRLLYISPQIEQMLGYPVADWLTDRDLWARAVHSADLERVLATIAQAQATGQPYATEYRYIARDGRTVWVQSEGILVRDGDGRPLHWQGINVDVTARKLAEEALREAEANYRTLVEQIPAIIYTQAQGGLTYISPQVETILGYTPGDILAKSDVFSRAAPSRRPRAGTGARRRGRTPTARRSSSSTGRGRADGEYVWLRDEAVLLRDGMGQPLHWQGVLIDITERRRMREALRESDERFHGAFDLAPIGMAIVAPDGRFLQVNRALCAIVGYSEEELLATDYQAITHHDDRAADLAQDRAMLAGEIRTYQMEKRYLHKDGYVVWILLSVSLVHDEQGSPAYFISQIEDITERKRAQEALHESEMRFAAFMGNSPALAWMKNEDLRYVYVNDTYERVLFHTREEIIGQDDLRLWPEETASAMRVNDRTVIETGRVLETYEAIPTVDGKIVTFLVLKFPFQDASGRRFVGGMGVDVTERLRAEAELQEQYRAAERARGEADAILDATNEAMLLVAPDSRIATVNRRSSELLGLAASAVVGQPVDVLRPHLSTIFTDPTRLEELLADGEVDPAASSGSLRGGEIMSQRWPEGRGARADDGAGRQRLRRVARPALRLPRRHPRAGGRPDEDRVRGAGVARAADAADLDPGLRRSAARRRGGRRPGRPARISPYRPQQRPAVGGPDQRSAQHLADRVGPARALPTTARSRSPDHRRRHLLPTAPGEEAAPADGQPARRPADDHGRPRPRSPRS